MISLSDLNLESISSVELGELLINAKKAYYTSAKPIMDDHTYDTLEDILKKKSPHHRLFSKIGNPNFDTGFDKKHHVMPMGSQNKVNKIDDLIHYFELKKVLSILTKEGDRSSGRIRGGFCVQPKCDGISLEIEYQNGQLVDAITRGDGHVGDVITQNVVKMKNAVVNLSNHFTGSVRCEIMVTKDDFKKLNKISEEKYSNPRNAASGLSQRLDSKYSEFCSLYAVDIFPANKTEQDKITYLKTLGFVPVESFICQNFSEIESIYQSFLTQDREKYPFEIDGLVIKINDLKLAESIGSKNNRPKFQVAYKFPASTNQTVIKSIVWQVGPMGTITPVAEVDPIELSGAIITFASLANYDLIKEKNININDVVEIQRRGDVIPHIEKVVAKVSDSHALAPTHCPACQTKLIIDNKFIRCPNISQCPGQILGSLQLFCDTLEIKGISDKTIAKLYQLNLVKLPGDFYHLKVSDFKNIAGLGNKSGTNIVREIQAKKTLTLKQILDAAIIPNFSSQRIIQIINAGFNTPEKILNLTVSQLEALPGIQITLAEKIYQGIQARRDFIQSILNNVEMLDSTSLNNKQTLLNKSFAITGTLSQPRKVLEDKIISLGGKLSSSVTFKTNYLITNETESNSSKFVTAKKLNIPIINEESFSKLIN